MSDFGSLSAFSRDPRALENSVRSKSTESLFSKRIGSTPDLNGGTAVCEYAGKHRLISTRKWHRFYQPSALTITLLDPNDGSQAPARRKRLTGLALWQGLRPIPLPGRWSGRTIYRGHRSTFMWLPCQSDCDSLHLAAHCVRLIEDHAGV